MGEYIISTTSSTSNLAQTSTHTPSKSKEKKKLKIPPTLNVQYLPKSQSMLQRAEQFKKTLHSLSTPQDLRNFTDSKLEALQSIKAQKSLREKKKITQIKKKKTNDDFDLSELGISES